MRRRDENVIALFPQAHASRRPQKGEGSSASGINGIIEYIVEHQRADQSQRWLAMIVESSSDAIIGKSVEGVILSWNRAAERLFGYSATAMIGCPIAVLFPCDDADEVRSFLERSGQGEHVECREIACIRQDGQRIYVSLTVSPIKNKAGAIIGAATIARDITERQRAEDRLRYLALHDPLTGLPNRFLFREHVTQTLAQARRHDQQMALLFIDLDRFKEINDSLGHQTGDRLLQAIASRLWRCLRAGDTVARLGGDEFVVSLPDITDSSDATTIAQKILETLREPFHIGSHALNVSGSIGIGIYPADGQDMETLLHAADAAMYRAKKKGRGNYQYGGNADSVSAANLSRKSIGN